MQQPCNWRTGGAAAVAAAAVAVAAVGAKRKTTIGADDDGGGDNCRLRDGPKRVAPTDGTDAAVAPSSPAPAARRAAAQAVCAAAMAVAAAQPIEADDATAAAAAAASPFGPDVTALDPAQRSACQILVQTMAHANASSAARMHLRPHVCRALMRRAVTVERWLNAQPRERAWACGPELRAALHHPARYVTVTASRSDLWPGADAYAPPPPAAAKPPFDFAAQMFFTYCENRPSGSSQPARNAMNEYDHGVMHWVLRAMLCIRFVVPPPAPPPPNPTVAAAAANDGGGGGGGGGHTVPAAAAAGQGAECKQQRDAMAADHPPAAGSRAVADGGCGGAAAVWDLNAECVDLFRTGDAYAGAPVRHEVALHYACAVAPVVADALLDLHPAHGLDVNVVRPVCATTQTGFRTAVSVALSAAYWPLAKRLISICDARALNVRMRRDCHHPTVNASAAEHDDDDDLSDVPLLHYAVNAAVQPRLALDVRQAWCDVAVRLCSAAVAPDDGSGYNIFARHRMRAHPGAVRQLPPHEQAHYATPVVVSAHALVHHPYTLDTLLPLPPDDTVAAILRRALDDAYRRIQSYAAAVPALLAEAFASPSAAPGTTSPYPPPLVALVAGYVLHPLHG